MWFWLSKGGLMMVPIILCSVLSLTVIIERILFYFSLLRFNPRNLISQVIDRVRKNKISEAVDVCEKNPFYITNILKAGLVYYESSREMVKENMDAAALYEIPQLEKNLNLLNVISQITPLLGFLGTAVGLLKGFYAISEKTFNAGAIVQADLAQGLGQALVVTVTGLSVALVASIAYSYFAYKVNFCILETERAITELLEALSQRRYGNEV
ncbi:MAG: MotA/TolQ/ExbB proton channel family protein [Candidatus Omnitrophota bacterium]